MLFADKLGMPKKIKDLAESLDLEVTNHHDPEFDAKLCALIFGELTDKYPSYQELIRKIDDQPKTNNNYFNQPSEDVLEENEEHLSNYQITQNELENIDLIGKGIVITGNFSIEREEIKTFLMKIGGQIKSGITGKVDFVFAGEDCGWSKIQKINDLNQSKKANIRILNEADLNYLILKSATKLFSVLLASKRPLITELADKLRLKYPLLPTISPCPTMRLEAIRSIIPISCRRYPKSV